MTKELDEIHNIVLEAMTYPEDIRYELVAADIIRIARKPERAKWPTKRR